MYGCWKNKNQMKNVPAEKWKDFIVLKMYSNANELQTNRYYGVFLLTFDFK